MNATPLLSVCIVAYNQEFFMKKVLDSILAQKVDFEYEIVIGEDCSTDGTRRICEEYVAAHPDKIRLLENSDGNLGLNLNFLRTFKACRGKYIAYLESDDYWCCEDKLQRQVNILEREDDVVLVHTNYKVWDVKKDVYYERQIRFYGECIRERQSGIEAVKAMFALKTRGVKTSTCVYRRAVLEEILKEDEFAYANKAFPTQDFQLFIDMSYRGRFAFIDEETTVIGLGDTISANSDIMKRYKFVKGYYNIGVYYIDKYSVPIESAQIWFQNELHWLVNFAFNHSECLEEVKGIVEEAVARKYSVTRSQKMLLWGAKHRFVHKMTFPIYRKYVKKKDKACALMSND